MPGSLEVKTQRGIGAVVVLYDSEGRRLCAASVAYLKWLQAHHDVALSPRLATLISAWSTADTEPLYTPNMAHDDDTEPLPKYPVVYVLPGVLPVVERFIRARMIEDAHSTRTWVSIGRDWGITAGRCRDVVYAYQKRETSEKTRDAQTSAQAAAAP